MKPWQTLDRVDTAEGALELRRRGERDFLITIAGRVLMTSGAHRSEDALARLACAGLSKRERPRVLIGGLGMAYTLRAALDVLPPSAEVQVAELNPQVVSWCRGALAELTAQAVEDPRVTVRIVDVSVAIAQARGLDAILLDLYEGPHAATQRAGADPLYGDAALERTAAALRPDGIFAVWSEEADQPFEMRLRRQRWPLVIERLGGGRTHVVYVARAPGA